MNDFMGQEVKVGDYVVFNQSGKGLTFGLVEKITPKKVKVIYREGWGGLGTNSTDTVHKDHSCVHKVTCDTPQFRACRERLKNAIMAKIKRDLS